MVDHLELGFANQFSILGQVAHFIIIFPFVTTPLPFTRTHARIENEMKMTKPPTLVSFRFISFIHFIYFVSRQYLRFPITIILFLFAASLHIQILASIYIHPYTHLFFALSQLIKLIAHSPYKSRRPHFLKTFLVFYVRHFQNF